MKKGVTPCIRPYGFPSCQDIETAGNPSHAGVRARDDDLQDRGVQHRQPPDSPHREAFGNNIRGRHQMT